MQTEELGSVYEGLLELTPRLHGSGRSMSFADGFETKGNERKTSGSYYTPDSLVQTLLDSALDPVLDRLEAETETNGSDPAAHLLTVTVIDPACGSGHFLLAAARRIATRVARLRKDGVPSQDDYRIALRDTVRLCIYGVDRNPMAVELSRVALWIETVEPGKPLGFLDANLRCGDALLGVFSLDALNTGIPEAAYKPLAGDDKLVAKVFNARNKEDLKGQGRLGLFGQTASFPIPPILANAASALRTLPEDTEEDVAQRIQFFYRLQHEHKLIQWMDAADLYIAAFLSRKKKTSIEIDSNAEFPGMPLVPVSSHVWKRLEGHQVQGDLLEAASRLAKKARAFHWPLEFPHVFLNAGADRSGFDVVLGNPPWERIKLQEQEFFASREPDIAEAANAAARGRLIKALKDAPVGSKEWTLHEDFEIAKRAAEASSAFARVSALDNGRFPLTGRGDVNTYALFAELFVDLTSVMGRSGVVVPTGIATDVTTAPFFASLVERRRLASLIDFENRAKLFPHIDSRIKFSLLTVAHDIDAASFVFFLTNTSQLGEPNRGFTLSPQQIAVMNPNTKTTPIFRSVFDSELTSQIYNRVPVLVDTARGHDPWQFAYMTKMFDMADSSGSFKSDTEMSEDEKLLAVSSDGHLSQWLPLYEAKMIHHFDHRWATQQGKDTRVSTLQEKADPFFESRPRYWVAADEVAERVKDRWERAWMLGWRDITNSTNERTVIAAFYPAFAIAHTLRNFLLAADVRLQCLFCANCSSIVLDYVARQKLGGTHLTVESIQQLPILSPTAYDTAAFTFIVPRVLELVYTSYSMRPFAHDLGFDGKPFAWDEDRRAILRAELDAWFVRAYGLSRDDLRYILDPADVLGAHYPSETFRGLKINEIRRFGEYRTQRLVLEAWDRLTAGEALASELGHPSQGITVQKVRPTIVYDDLIDDAWAIVRSEPYKPLVDATRLLAAILEEVQNAPRDEIGVIYAYASKPEKLVSFLPPAERETWRRLIGADAHPRPAGVLKMPDRPDLPFDQARSWLISRNAILQDLTAGTWSEGDVDTGLPLDGWPEGRARFVCQAVRSLGLAKLLEPLTVEEKVWEVKNA